MPDETARTELSRLREGQRLHDVGLSLAEAGALNASGLVSVDPGEAGWRVTAGTTVGVVRCGELVVRVQPQVGVVQALRLLARAYGLSPADIPDDALLDDALPDGRSWEGDLPTALAVLFAREASSALVSGPSRRYRTEEQTLPVLRGRVRVRDQQLRRFGLSVPMEVTVDEWTTDTDANRRLRAAARQLLLLPGLPGSAVDRLHRVDRMLADVPLAPPPPSIRPSSPRLPSLRPRLVDLVLGLRAVEYRIGPVQVFGGTLCLATLFERLVTRVLTEAAPGFAVRARMAFGLDTAGRLAIRPDLVVTAGSRIVAVADARYRPLDDHGRLSHPDAYRLLAYCARLGLDTGHLIYATDSQAPDLWANEESRPAPYDVVGAGIRLVLHGIDLRQPVADLERSVHKVFLKLVRLQPISAIA